MQCQWNSNFQWGQEDEEMNDRIKEFKNDFKNVEKNQTAHNSDDEYKSIQSDVLGKR
jgi:hypothetical protein